MIIIKTVEHSSRFRKTGKVGSVGDCICSNFSFNSPSLTWCFIKFDSSSTLFYSNLTEFNIRHTNWPYLNGIQLGTDCISLPWTGFPIQFGQTSASAKTRIVMDLSSIKRNIQNAFSNSALKTKTFAGVTTASHGPSPSTGDNNNNDHTPDFCQFSYTTAPAKITP